MVRSIRNQKGFSLVELMVVVAIIGILSAIAIPQINKYMARARQTEAKTNLSAIYTSNKAFYAEYNVYDNRFNVIGYRPEGKLRYNVGWADTGSQADLSQYGYSTEIKTTDASISAFAHCNTVGGATGTSMGTNGCYVMADGQGNNGALPATALEPTSAFIAGAAGKISTGQLSDQWTISQVKEMKNVRDGTQ